LYGIADVWVGNVSVDNGTTDRSTTSMTSGGVSTSRWGMKGSEDLGGGLKANFQLESSINMDDGTTGSGFNRQAWVGFSGNFGDVRFGRVSSPFDNVEATSTALWDSDLNPVNNPGGGVFRTSGGFIDKPANTIYYKTPSFSGFGGEVSYSLDEDNENGTFDKNEIAITSLSLTYAAGPFAAQFAYQEEERADVPTDDDFTFMRLGGSYNFGMATVKATYGRAENATGDVGTSATHTADAQTDEWQIGVDVPMSSALTLSAAYAESTDDAIGAIPEVKRSGFGLAAAYSLSKRTTLYGGVKTATEEQTGVHDIDTTVYAVGVKHTF
ncbi:MAG: porin, partial [Rhodoferax sp.]|uniref:porin n=1 Tax=Rhodoferax sp. TaxID=50421 RepID=UPI003BB4912F